MTDVIGWARLNSTDSSASETWPALVPPVSRRGAWYPVVDRVHLKPSPEPDRDRTLYVIDIGPWRLAVPANILEVRESLPDQFGVVVRSPTDPIRSAELPPISEPRTPFALDPDAASASSDTRKSSNAPAAGRNIPWHGKRRADSETC